MYGVGQFAPPKEEKKEDEDNDDDFDQRAKGDKREARRGGRGRGRGVFDSDRPRGERPKFFKSDKEDKLKKQQSEEPTTEEPKVEEAKKPWKRDAELKDTADYSNANNWF